jgi:hypothetical protein
MGIGAAISTASISILLGLLAWFWITPEYNSKKPTIHSRFALAAAVLVLCLFGAIALSFGLTALAIFVGKDLGLTGDLIWLAYWILSLLWIGYSFVKPRRKMPIKIQD